MRLDLTQNRLYTLSPGTKQVLGELKEPINLYFYFSREAAAKQSPLIMPYANRVREFLEEITARVGRQDPSSGDRSAALLRRRGPRRRGRTAIACRRAAAASRCTSAWRAPTRPTAARSSRASRPTARNSWNTTWPSSSRSWPRRRKPVIGLMSSLAHAGPVQSHDRTDGRALADARRSSSSCSPSAP